MVPLTDKAMLSHIFSLPTSQEPLEIPSLSHPELCPTNFLGVYLSNHVDNEDCHFPSSAVSTFSSSLVQIENPVSFDPGRIFLQGSRPACVVTHMTEPSNFWDTSRPHFHVEHKSLPSPCFPGLLLYKCTSFTFSGSGEPGCHSLWLLLIIRAASSVGEDFQGLVIVALIHSSWACGQMGCTELKK